MISQDIFTAIKEVTRVAGQAILSIYEGPDFDVSLKEDHSPLTKADNESNRIICARLADLTPSIPIISEENKDIPYAERKQYRLLWLVDPLDGTKEFIKRNGEFTINIALIEDGRPTAGIVYVPVTDEMYYAMKGKGAFLEKEGKTTTLNVSQFEMEDKGLNVVCSRSHLNPETEGFINMLNEPQTVSKGSALKFMLIANGEAQLYPRVAPTMEWDTAAAQCIVEEAGGFVVEFESRTPLVYNKESLLNPNFLAAGRLIVDR